MAKKQTKQELLALLNLRKAITDVLLQWDDSFDDHYPANWHSMDDMQSEAGDWIRKTVDKDLVNEILMEAVECKVPLFEYHGHTITDPFRDTTDRFDVDPVDHYGWTRIMPIVIAQLDGSGVW
jgi:hypothetical protein